MYYCELKIAWIRHNPAVCWPRPLVDTPGSPTTATQIHLANLRSTSGQGNHDGPYDPCGDTRLRNSSVSLEEKVRAMSGSGSFREGLEEGSTLSNTIQYSLLHLFDITTHYIMFLENNK